MSDRLAVALMRTGGIAIVYFGGWTYRCTSRGHSLWSRQVLYGAVLILACFVVTLAWQCLSKVKCWSWWTTFFGFTLSLIVVSIVAFAVIRSIL